MSEALKTLAKLRDDLPLFAKTCLKVRAKAGDIVPLVFNAAQMALHARLEAQKAEKGLVRAMLLKGRQMGASTYCAARFFHNAIMHRGVNVFVMAHEQSASDNLFALVDRYYRHMPEALRPHIGTSNIKEMIFDKLESGYVVATAGAKASGRSRSIQLYHGSEVAFWNNPAEHFSSSIQTVPLLPGTEVILESTSNGSAGQWYDRWHDAIAGVSDFTPIFLGWNLMPEYARDAGPNFVPDPSADDGEMSEVELAEVFSLSNEQLAWRRSKIMEVRSVQLFQQEYPLTAEESFQSAGHEPFISPISVLRARKRKADGHGPLIFGVDPASLGGDRFSIAARRGYEVLWVKHRGKVDPQEGIQWVRSLIDEHDPARVNIDAGGIGHAIVSGLRAAAPKYGEKIRGINFGGTSDHKLAKPKVPGPGNKRAEMWQRMRDWLDDPVGAVLPDLDALQSDMCAPQLRPKLSGDFILESKDDMRKRGVRSPDLADAICLTFAQNEYFAKYSEPRRPTPFGDVDSAPEQDIQTEYGGGSYGWMGI